MRIQPPHISSEHPSYAALDRAKNYIGFELNDAKLMAHMPQIADAFENVSRAILGQGRIDGTLKRMVGLIVSLSSGCVYCASHTSYTAANHGVESRKLEEIWNFQTSPLFSSAERAVLNLALNSSMVPNQVSDDFFDKLKEHYCDSEIIEIVSVISFYAFLNRFNSTLATDIEDAPYQAFQSLKIKRNESR